MPKSIITTKRLSLTEFQWAYLRNIVRDQDDTDMTNSWQMIRAIENAPVISETVNPAEEPTSEIDAWVIDAVNEGRDIR